MSEASEHWLSITMLAELECALSIASRKGIYTIHEIDLANWKSINPVLPGKEVCKTEKVIMFFRDGCFNVHIDSINRQSNRISLTGWWHAIRQFNLSAENNRPKLLPDGGDYYTTTKCWISYKNISKSLSTERA